MFSIFGWNSPQDKGDAAAAALSAAGGDAPASTSVSVTFVGLNSLPSSRHHCKDFACKLLWNGHWWAYVLLRGDSWAGHSISAESSADARTGIRTVITKVEKQGPYTRPYSVYLLHTKTAFSVKGAARRFREFRDLVPPPPAAAPRISSPSHALSQDSKIRAKFPSLPQIPEAGVFDALEPQVVAERRRVLQKYRPLEPSVQRECVWFCLVLQQYVLPRFTLATCTSTLSSTPKTCARTGDTPPHAPHRPACSNPSTSDVLAFLGVSASDVKPATGQRLNASSLRDANEWLLLSQKAAPADRVRCSTPSP